MPRLFSAKVILYFLFLFVLDATVLPVFHIRNVYPSFLCLLICYSGFEWGPQRTIYVACWAGLLRDFLGGGFLGLEASLYLMLALALNFVLQKIEREFPGMYFLITFLFIFIAGALRLLCACTEELPAPMVLDYLGLIALTATYSAALLPLFYFMTDRWMGQSHTKQYELFR